MGILYSHIVFQPPAPPSYADHGGVMTFRKARPDAASQSPPPPPAHAGSHYLTHPLIYLTTSRGSTIPAAYFHYPDSYYTILFSHGNGEDLGVTASYVLELCSALKTSVLCYDYSGYGLASGKPSEANCYADIAAAYSYLVADLRISPKRIVLFGRSLGSGPTVDLATRLRHNLGGVVLIAALTSCVRVVFNSPTTLKFDMFNNIDKIPNVAVPVFVVHGMDDDVVPFSHGLDLSRRARYPLEPLWIRDAGHNNLEASRFQYDVFLRYARVLHELRRWSPPNSPQPPAQADVPRRRDSLGAFAKAAGCFGRAVSTDEARPPSSRRRMRQAASSFSGGVAMPSLHSRNYSCDNANANGAAASKGAAGDDEHVMGWCDAGERSSGSGSAKARTAVSAASTGGLASLGRSASLAEGRGVERRMRLPGMGRRGSSMDGGAVAAVVR